MRVVRRSHSRISNVLIWLFALAVSSGSCLSQTLQAQTQEKELIPKLFRFRPNEQENKEPELIVQTNHPGCAEAVAFSPDDKTLASVGGIESKLWDVATGKELRFLKGEPLFLSDVSFSPDGNVLLTGGFQATLWDIRRRQGSIIGIGVGDGAAFTVAFSPDGQSFATGHSLYTVILWYADPKKEPVKLKGHTGYISSVVFSPDGRMLASGSKDTTVKVWDVALLKEVNSFRRHTAEVNSIAFSPDGKLLVSGSEDKTVKVWDVATGKELWSFGGHTGEIRTVAFSPDGRTVASGGTNKTIDFWDVITGQKVKTLNTSSVCSLAFSQNGNTLASGEDGRIVLWDVATGQEVKTLHSYSKTFFRSHFSPDGSTLASAGSDHTVLLWNLAVSKEPNILRGHTAQIFSTEFSPDGKTLASGGLDDAVILWDRQSGQKIRTLQGPAGGIYQLAFSADGRLLAGGGKNQTVTIWDAASGRRLRTLSGLSENVGVIVFSPDGKLVLADGPLGFIGKSAKVWEVATGQEIKIEKTPEWVARLGTKHDMTTPSGKVFRVYDESGKIVVRQSDGRENSIGNEVATLISFEGKGNEWAVITPDGRFDTNIDLNRKIEGLYWILPEDPSLALPLELFMREYYEPSLLPRILNGETLGTVRDLNKLNVAQPKVEITGLSLPDENDEVTVSVKVENGERVITRGGQKVRLVSGVYDLHLFRDGQLVKVAPHDSDKGLAKIPSDYELEKELPLWRNTTRLLSEDATSPKTVTFKVRLPKGKDAAQVEFTAYAFNEDRIKSDTVKGVWMAEQVTRLRKAQSVRPKVYLISVGVNETGHPKWTLNYASKDARQIQNVLGDKLAEQRRFDVVRFSLISEKLKDKQRFQASKENIRTVFDLLAGRRVEEKLLASIPGAKQLRKATPDDIIIMSFSSHGFTDDRGNFYILPSGLRFADGALDPASLVASDDISLWMKDIEADKLFMILDSCYSADFGGRNFKPGPMGSRGLGQLAYNKKLRILTAAKEQAYETSDLGMSVLSYVLLNKGLERGEADIAPADGKITFREWLEYAEKEVSLFYGTRRGTEGAGQGLVNRENAFLQKPYLFDFVRDGSDLEITRLPRK